jgi:hypothetical protein
LYAFSAQIAFSQGPVLPSDQQQINQNPASPPNALGSASNNASGQLVVGNRPIWSFVDPRNGIIYDRFIETENVPSQRWVTEEKMERRWVPEMQTENQQVTQVEYVPTVSYVAQPTSPSILRPFSQQQSQYQYIPKVDYVPVNKVVNVPVSVQRYVEKDIPVRIPKLVQVTESRQKYVDRPRAGQPMNAVTSTYATTPIGTNASYANTLPSVPAHPVAVPPTPTSPVIAPTTNYQTSASNGSVATYVPPLVPVQNANMIAYNPNAASTTPLLKWPSWLGGNGPLLKSPIFSQSQVLPVNNYGSNPGLVAVSSPSVGFGGSVAYAYQPTSNQANATLLPAVPSAPTPQTNVLPQQSLVSRMTIQPSTSGSGSRTAAQTGMPATEFR